MYFLPAVMPGWVCTYGGGSGLTQHAQFSLPEVKRSQHSRVKRPLWAGFMRKPDAPCVRCGTLLWGGTGSLPSGERMCRDCRLQWPVISGSKPAAKAARKSQSGTRLRGYGADHKRLRAIWAKVVESGDAYCARCGKWISPGSPWDLGHDDKDRTKYKGPEHRKCNRGAPGIARGQAANTVPRRQSRVW
jgi:hypothetical protein